VLLLQEFHFDLQMATWQLSVLHVLMSHVINFVAINLTYLLISCASNNLKINYTVWVMLSPIKSCSLDPVPTFILWEFIDVLLPFVNQTVSASCLHGQLPDWQKHAIVQSILYVEADCMSHGHQLNEYLSANDLLDRKSVV